MLSSSDQQIELYLKEPLQLQWHRIFYVIAAIGVGTAALSYVLQSHLLISSIIFLIAITLAFYGKRIAHQEKLLRESEQKYRQVIEQATEIIYTTDENGKFSYANTAALNASGYSIEELSKLTYLDLIVPDHRQEVGKFYMRQFLENIPTSYRDVQFMSKSGNVKWFGQNVSITVEHGKTVGFHVVARDVTEQMRAEEESKLLQQVTAAISDAEDFQSALNIVLRMVCEKTGWILGQAWVPSQDETVLECSQAYYCTLKSAEVFRNNTMNFKFEKGIGLPGRAWLSKQPAWIYNVTTDKNFPRAPYAIEAGLHAGMGIPVMADHGVVAVIEFFVSESREEDKRLVNLVMAVATQLGVVLRRKQAEEKTKNTLSLLHATLESTADGILVVNADGKIASFNQQFIKMWRVPDEIILSRDDAQAIEYALSQLKTPDKFLAKVKELYATPEAESFDILEFIDGRVFERYSQPQRLGREIVGRVWSYSDVTERMKAEAAVHELNRTLEQRVHDRTAQLEAVNKELESFSYSVSHDLRSPLRHMSGFVDLLQKDTQSVLNENNRRHITIIANSAKKMGVLIDDLLAFSRMGRTAMHKASVDLNKLIHQAVEELGDMLHGRTIEWNISAMPTVYGDAAMLQLVMNNLISNALKYTNGRDTTRIDIGNIETDKHEHIIFIRDNGVGFDMAYVDKLFGVFQRLHNESRFEGTGIGLANVKRIVNRHGGKVWAEGAVNKGATFYFSLPKGTKNHS